VLIAEHCSFVAWGGLAAFVLAALALAALALAAFGIGWQPSLLLKQAC